jgi:hypothetical protein
MSPRFSDAGNHESFHARMRPAFKKRQGPKSQREVVRGDDALGSRYRVCYFYGQHHLNNADEAVRIELNDDADADLG